MMAELLTQRITHPINILLVEDNLGDATLIREAFKKSERNIRISLVRDGVEAMEYLKGLGPYARAAKPSLILLDLSMPKKDGFEVLHDIKYDPFLEKIPVVILSHSDLESDVRRAYEGRANFYLVKPSGLDELFSSMGKVEEIWLANIDQEDD